jgi:hypothetical protein
MRANPDQVLAGGYAVSNFRALPIAHHLNRSGSHSKNYPDCSQISCTSVLLRDYDLGSWRAGFPMTLEDISADIIERSGEPGIWAVIVRRDEGGDGLVGEDCLMTHTRAKPMLKFTPIECVRLEALF